MYSILAALRAPLKVVVIKMKSDWLGIFLYQSSASWLQERSG